MDASVEPRELSSSVTRYAELHCRTNYSFLRGASHAEELVERAVAFGYQALAITDRQSVAGIVRAHVAAKPHGLKLIYGAELFPRDGWPLVVWASDRAAYGRLTRLLTVGSRRAPKGECWLTMDDIAQHALGLWAGIIPPHTWPCSALDESSWSASGGPINPIHKTDREGIDNEWIDDEVLAAGATPERVIRWTQALQDYRELFGERVGLLAELYWGTDDADRLHRLQGDAAAARLPLIAAGNVQYHARSRLSLCDVVAAIRLGTTVENLGTQRFTNAERHLKSWAELQALYAGRAEMLEQTLHIAEVCRFSLDELRYEYPEELAPHGLTPMQYLRQLTWQGAARRYPAGVPAKVRDLLQHELTLIQELRYEAYFLTVWDLVHFARQRGILCQGRGSAANSAVCYCLEVTAVDPAQADLLFERFVSRERDEAPDIDVDFEHERREEVLQYLYEKYGRERAGLAAEVITYRTRSAIRDVGKALGLSLDRIDALAKHVEGYTYEEQLPARCRQVGIDPQSLRGQQLIQLVEELIGFPRHLSQHVGGMVMTRGPLCELVPIENAAMPGRTVLCWDKDDLEALGILKVDCLALGMLTAIRKAFEAIYLQTGKRLTLASIPPDDAEVYHMISEADTMGVFQIESRAQMSMLPRLRPRNYYDLVVEVAIVRPGPIQGQMVHPYLRRRMGLEPVEYPNDAIREVLEKTLGVPIFQEQAMRLAVVAAGFTPGQADQLRRAMGAWRKSGVIDAFRQKLVEGMLARGLSAEFAEQLFRQLRGFGEYGFPESHAASFALLVYVSAYIKHYYPAAFTLALVNSQPMGFYAPAQLIRDAQRHGVTVLPIDVNASHWDCVLEWADRAVTPLPAIRLGLRLIHGLAEHDVRQLVAARGAVPFASLSDLVRRTGWSQAVLARVTEADGLRSFGRNRREMLWEALGTTPRRNHRGRRTTTQHGMPLLDRLSMDDEPAVNLPPMESIEQVFADYDTTGLSLRAHPLSFYRERLTKRHVVTAADLLELRDDQHVTVAGIVLLRQRPGTAKGITFVTLEDESGTVNLVVHQRTWERFYPIARRSPAWVVSGRLEHRKGVIHVIAERIDDLAASLRRWHLPARDFR